MCLTEAGTGQQEDDEGLLPFWVLTEHSHVCKCGSRPALFQIFHADGKSYGYAII